MREACLLPKTLLGEVHSQVSLTCSQSMLPFSRKLSILLQAYDSSTEPRRKQQRKQVSYFILPSFL